MGVILKYKEYSAEINFSPEDKVFHGKVLGVADLIIFESDSVEGLNNSFSEAIEDYLLFSQKT